MPGKIDPIRKYRQWLFAGFLQDDVRVTDRLSLNLGLRYEAVTVPTEVDGKISNLRSVTDAELTIGDPWHDNPSLKNFAPRVGVAWDPLGSGQTSVRAGFGIFHDQILPKYYFFSGSLNPPFTTRTSIVNPPFPNVIANFDTERLHPRATADGERRPADAVHHAVQRERAARDRRRPRRDGRLRRLARPQPDSAGRRQPRAGNHRQWRQDLSARRRAPEPQFHRRVAAR